MSIASDFRNYADSAVTEGRKLLDSTLSQAQAQLNDVSGQVSDVVAEVRANAEKAVNFDAIRSALEPYLAQAKSIQADVAERAEAILAELKKDPRFAKAIEVAEEVSEAVVETARERVVKPVQAFAGRGSKPAAKPSPTKATRKPAATKPATPKPAAKKAPARKAPAKRATKA